MKRGYFSVVSFVVLALSVWGFSDNLVWDVGQPSNQDPKFIVHGVFCLAWVALFFAQSSLVRRRNLRLHRKLGIAAFLVAIGVTLSTAYVFVAVWKGWDAMSYLVRANRLLLPGFSLMVLLAFLSRRRPDRHKRFVLIGTLYMLEPVLSRAFDPVEPLLLRLMGEQIDMYWWVFFYVVWSGLFLSLVVYDRVVEDRVHPVTRWGIVGFVVAWLIALLS